MRLLLQKSLTLDADVLERITQAGLFYADSVALRATAQIPDKLYRRANELIDLGLITTWAHEYEVSAGGVAPAPSAGRILHTRPDQVLSLAEVRTMALGVDEELLKHRDLPYSEQPTALREGISEVVQLRHSMNLLRLTDALGADGIVASPSAASQLTGGIRPAETDPDRRAEVVRELVAKCAFGPLGRLPISAIDECRKEIPHFRRLLDRLLSDEQAEEQPHSAEELAQVITDAYADLSRERPHLENHDEQTWDVIGSVLPHAVIVTALEKQIEWFRHRGRRRPFLLLSKLKRHTAK